MEELLYDCKKCGGKIINGNVFIGCTCKDSEDESWDDIFLKYEKTLDPMTRSGNYHDHVLQWLKGNYDTPIRKSNGT